MTSPTAAQIGSTCRVLIVDDNEIVAGLLCEALAAYGHTLEIAMDGLLALSVARDFHPEVILLDLGLPSLDGCEVAQRLRGGPGGEHLRIFAISGNSRPEDSARALAAGFDRYFVKPVDLDTLVSAIG